MTRYATDGPRTAAPEDLNLQEKIQTLLMGVNLPRPENHSTPKDYGLPFEQLRFEGAFGVDIEAWQIEHATNHGLILMFHGHGVSKDSLLPTAALFYKMGWDCGLIDFHGSGGSGTNVTSFGWYEATDVAAALNYFSPMYEKQPVILYGVSMGAAAVLRAMHTDPLIVDGIILELPYDTLINAARQRFGAMHIPSWPAAEFLIFYGGMHGSFNGFELQPAEYAKSVHCPTLVMNGELDPRAPPEQALAVFRNLAGPKIHKQFRGLGHRNFTEHDPANWLGTVTPFLNSIWRGRQ